MSWGYLSFILLLKDTSCRERWVISLSFSRLGKKSSSIKEGGLGIHKLSTFNKALLDHGVGQW